MCSSMNWIWILLGVFSFANANTEVSKDDRIVGGSTTSIYNEPYIVQLLFDNSFVCGGSIINARWVVTAAHCVYGYGHQPTRYSVHAGATYIKGSKGVTRVVAKVVRHGNYNPNTYNNDIAMLKLTRPLPLNGKSIKKISLCPKPVPAQAVVKVSGWGYTQEGGNVSNQLRTVKVTKMSQAACQNKYSQYSLKITSRMMCAARLGKDSCSGDSGGPLVYQNRLCGVVSWGVGCAREDAPGVYANVYPLRSFVNHAISNN